MQNSSDIGGSGGLILPLGVKAQCPLALPRTATDRIPQPHKVG